MAFLLAAALLAACQQDIHKAQMKGVEKHANGLLMPLPEGFSAQATSVGFDVTEDGTLRNPLTFQLHLVRDQNPNFSRKYLGLFGPYEQTRKDEAVGSSGGNHRLVVWLPAGTCWIVLTAQNTQEFRNPNFLPARAAAALSSVTAASGC